MSVAQNVKNQEQIIDNNWRELAASYKNIKLTKEQNTVVTAGRAFYEFLKNKLTLNGSYDLASVRVGLKMFSGEYFPHQVKENAAVIAWILKSGDNQSHLEKQFPNQVHSDLYPRDVEIKGAKLEKTKVGENVYKNMEVGHELGYQPVLVTLHYLLMCEEWGCDSIISAKFKKGRASQLVASTTFYNIVITFGSGKQLFDSIRIMPKKAAFDAAN